MFKKISILTSLLLCAFFSFAQTPYPNNGVGISNDSTLYLIKGATKYKDGNLITVYPDTATANLKHLSYYHGANIMVGNTVYVRDSTGTKWLVSGGGSSSLIPGGAITSLPSLGDNPGTNISSGDFIIGEFYKSPPPLATLTGGVTLELQSAATLNYTLNYSASRQAKTNPLATIVVAGTNETFSQPSAPGTVSGTQAVSFASNTDVTYSNIATTTDSKTATATTTFSFLPKRYWGFINVSDTNGIRTYGYDDSKITSLNNELSSSKVKSWNTGNPTGEQIIVYAYYYTAGGLSHLDLNGFPSIDAFSIAQRNFTNAAGFTGQWIIYWSKNGQTLSSDIIAY
ncbi:MAG: hypothetical protein ABI091_26820 [Ferruginibacter sp.]